MNQNYLTYFYIGLFVLFIAYAICMMVFKPNAPEVKNNLTFDKKESSFCTICGYTGVTNTKPKGSTGLEIFLLLCFLIPGIIYAVWRATNRERTCPNCNHNSLIPTSSPKAQAILQNKY